MADVTPEAFAKALLRRLSLPVTDNNVRALVAFQYQEGGHSNSALFNPLNTMLRTSSSVNFQTGKPGGGVQAYSNWNEGLEATAKTLSQGNMRPIFDSLRANASPAETVAKIGSSDWGWWDPKKGKSFLLPHAAADAIVNSGSLFESYASKAYSGAGSLLPSKQTMVAVGAVVAGVSLVVGLIFVFHEVRKARRVAA